MKNFTISHIPIYTIYSINLMESQMPTKSRTTVVKSASLEKVIETSLAALNAANDNGTKAVAALSKIAKKLSAEGKRLSKKRATLIKRKKATTAKLKKSDDAATRKLFKATTAELNAVRKMAAKSTSARSANTEELRGLKAQAKRAKAYTGVLTKADKILNKPVKRRRKKRASKKTA
ncbi:MAG TPA: hypothetical protein ENI64_13215 [Gammaproteobacteria bacterium]|nr:hypothetical protein [Gammaproteobacteria bacterium]